jgi:hypothetical protein
MRAVWSFWSKPYRTGQHHHWLSELHHTLAWSLSVQEASKHYPDTWLYTDDDGARLLVDDLGLPFVHVCTDLNALVDHDPGGWNLGKLLTYRSQSEPFIHLDYDVFLWLPLPERLTHADMFAEKLLPFIPGASWYRPERVERAVAGVGGWLPDEWTWFRSSGRALYSAGGGLLGGNRLDFIRHVYNHAFAVIEHRANRPALAIIDQKMCLMSLLEEFLPTACIEYHHLHADSPFRGVTIDYLFEPEENLFEPETAARSGYTHLIGDAKRNPAVAKLLEDRMRRDNPAQLERCMKVARRRVGG